MNRGDEITTEISDFATGGKAVARIDGLVVFVGGAVPGDVVKARIRSVKKSYLEAELLSVVRPSTLRTDPRCSHFGICGGCKWQQASYPAQLRFKRQQVVDAFERIGGLRDVVVNDVIGSDDSYFYRNKMEFSFGPRWMSREEFREHGDAETGCLALGLHPAGMFSKVLDIDECFLQSPLSNRVLDLVRSFALEKKLTYYSTIIGISSFVWAG
jgi:23S rRNA (uracil1939-C5)-methyltransferase